MFSEMKMKTDTNETTDVKKLEHREMCKVTGKDRNTGRKRHSRVKNRVERERQTDRQRRIEKEYVCACERERRIEKERDVSGVMGTAT